MSEHPKRKKMTESQLRQALLHFKSEAMKLKSENDLLKRRYSSYKLTNLEAQNRELVVQTEKQEKQISFLKEENFRLQEKLNNYEEEVTGSEVRTNKVNNNSAGSEKQMSSDLQKDDKKSSYEDFFVSFQANENNRKEDN